MNIENAKAQMRKGVLELCILSIIADKPAYPSDIIEALKQSELIVVEGTLYPMLTRLKQLGLLDYQWVESRTGPPRKYYRLTDTGHSFFNELQVAWHDLVKQVGGTLTKSETIATTVTDDDNNNSNGDNNNNDNNDNIATTDSNNEGFLSPTPPTKPSDEGWQAILD